MYIISVFHFERPIPYVLLLDRPGWEAEAELVFLNHTGCIVAIMTVD